MKKLLLILVVFFLVACEQDVEIQTINLGLFHPIQPIPGVEGCGYLKVHAKPNYTFSNSITNIQFTIRWETDSIEITDFESDFPFELGWGTGRNGGYNYACFVFVGFQYVNWIAGQEYCILTLNHSLGKGYKDFIITNDEWAEQHNGLAYIEVWGSDKTGYIYNQAFNTYIGGCE